MLLSIILIQFSNRQIKETIMTGINGDKEYIRKLLKIAIPMMIQNGISNFVNLLDNLMIGRVGTNALSGVAIANQLIFVFYLVIFGATAGVGIFTAQYKGSGDDDGIRHTFQFKIIFNTFLAAVCVAVLAIFSRNLINLFLLGEGDPADAAETLEIGVKYMNIILISLVPIGITQAYAGTLRDLGSTKVPMFASLVAIFVNLVGNYILIYGHLGLPALGASGAAIATVISRFVELGILVIYTGRHSDLFPFIKGAFKTIKIPGRLALRFLQKALPLMANETLWSLGMTTINQSYSYRSLDAVAALNIQSTIWNLMAVAFIAMGEAVGIMMGHILGSGELEGAKEKAGKMRMVTVLCGLIFGLLLAAVSPFFPLLYNTSDYIRHLATVFILISAVMMPFCSYTHASYFIIRSGGNAFITVLFDSVYTWVIVVPLAFCLSRFTDMNVTWMLAIVNGMEVIKCSIAFVFVKSGIWVKNIVK